MKRSLLTTLFLFLLGTFIQAQALKIHHINVGQGDATLFVSPTGKTLLIDAGDNGKGTSAVLPYLQNLGVTKLDYVVVTHYHADHLGGMDEVINTLKGANIGVVYDRGTVHTVPTSAVYSNYAAAAATASGGRHTLSAGTTIDLGGGVTLKCMATDGNVLNYGPVPNCTRSENDLSNAWLVTYGDFRYFTGGDSGGESSAYADLETPISFVTGQVDACKVDHHGSEFSSNQTFVNTLNPTTTIFMVGNGNSYHHPVQSTLDRWAAANSYMYLTQTGNGGTLAAGTGVVANGSIVLSTTGVSNYAVAYGTHTDTYSLHKQSTQVSVSISPSATTMYPNVYQLFKATVANASSTAVTWTCTGGTISTSGNYKAPVVTATQTYKVRATSVADTTKYAEATVTVKPSTTITFAEVESNNSTAAANVVPDTSTKITGTISSTTDADFFKINVAAGRTVTVNMTGPSGADFDLYLLNSAGSVLKLSEGSTCTESVTYQNTGTTTATYYIKAIFSSGSSLTGAYNLTLLR